MTVFQQIEAANDSGHRFDEGRRWAASISLGFDARPDADKTATRMTHVRHKGPLRVQRPFYPEGRNGCCHVYLLHPPGGLVSGDAGPGIDAPMTTSRLFEVT